MLRPHIANRQLSAAELRASVLRALELCLRYSRSKDSGVSELAGQAAHSLNEPSPVESSCPLHYDSTKADQILCVKFV